MLDLALAAQVLVWLAVSAGFAVSRRASIYHPLTIYLGFHGLVFVLRPLAVQYLGFDAIWRYMEIQPSEHELILTLAVSSAALVFFAAACLITGNVEPGFSSAAPISFTPAHRRGLWLTTLLLSPFIAYSIHSLLDGGMRGEHIGGTFVLTGASGYTLEAQYMAGPLICAWLAVTRFKWTVVLPTLLYVCYRSYAGWSRWTIVLLFLGIMLVYSWQQRNRWLPVWAYILALPVFILFLTLGQNRDYFKQFLSGEHITQTSEGSSSLERIRLKYDTQEFANFDFLCFVVAAVPGQTGTFTYGAQYLQLFTEPIPRKLWPGKPAGAPIQTFNLNSYGNFLGLTPSMPGDGWMSGGWLGLFITLSLAGALLGVAHRWFWRHSADNMAALFYLVGLAMVPQWFRDGGISIAKFLFWNLSPLLIWLGLTWLLGPRRVPGYSLLLPRGARLRFHEVGPSALCRETHRNAVPSPSTPLPP